MNPVPRLEIKKKKNLITRITRWWVVLIGDNGEPLSNSEQLNSLAAADGNADAQERAFGAAIGTVPRVYE